MFRGIASRLRVAAPRIGSAFGVRSLSTAARPLTLAPAKQSAARTLAVLGAAGAAAYGVYSLQAAKPARAEAREKWRGTGDFPRTTTMAEAREAYPARVKFAEENGWPMPQLPPEGVWDIELVDDDEFLMAGLEPPLEVENEADVLAVKLAGGAKPDDEAKDDAAAAAPAADAAPAEGKAKADGASADPIAALKDLKRMQIPTGPITEEERKAMKDFYATIGLECPMCEEGVKSKCAREHFRFALCAWSANQVQDAKKFPGANDEASRKALADAAAAQCYPLFEALSDCEAAGAKKKKKGKGKKKAAAADKPAAAAEAAPAAEKPAAKEPAKAEAKKDKH